MRFFVLLLVVVMLSACQSQPGGETLQTISGRGASGPRWFKLPDGALAVSWVENLPDDTTLVAFAFQAQDGTWQRRTVAGSQGATDGNYEAAPQLAFAGDGRLVAVWMRRAPLPDHPFASQLWYATSADTGRTWTHVQPLPSDTTRTASHAFPFLLPQGDGTLRAFWLDGRGKLPHSQVFTARYADGRFGADTAVGGPACQCCKLQAASDGKGGVWLLYRAMLPGGMRDHVLARSTDFGQSFAAPKPIAREDWQLNACPHNGPALRVAEVGQAHAVWYSGGTTKGLYYGTIGGKPVKLAEAPGPKHSTLAVRGGQVFAAWDEPVDDAPATAQVGGGSGHRGHMNHGTSGGTAIWVWRSGQDKAQPLPEHNLSHPDLATARDGSVWLACKSGQGADAVIQVRRVE